MTWLQPRWAATRRLAAWIPSKFWGSASDEAALGTNNFVAAIDQALAWDLESLKGGTSTTGAHATSYEVPYDRTEVSYERDGVTITSFPVIHILNGAVGYRIDYAGQSVVFSGDTRPTMTLVEAAQGCDLLIHETFLPAETFAELMSFPAEKARMVVNKFHTPPHAAGLVFEMVANLHQRGALTDEEFQAEKSKLLS